MIINKSYINSCMYIFNNFNTFAKILFYCIQWLYVVGVLCILLMIFMDLQGAYVCIFPLDFEIPVHECVQWAVVCLYDLM